MTTGPKDIHGRPGITDREIERMTRAWTEPVEQPRELLDCGHYVWEHGPRGRCPR